MEFREFCVWCANTFGADGDTDQFATDMNELILKVAQPQTQRENEHPADMSDTKIDWATRLFSAFDADDSGSLGECLLLGASLVISELRQSLENSLSSCKALTQI